MDKPARLGRAVIPAFHKFKRGPRYRGLSLFGEDAGQCLHSQVEYWIEFLISANTALRNGSIHFRDRRRVDELSSSVYIGMACDRARVL